MPRSWPKEIRDAIAAAIKRGDLRTTEVYRRVKSGHLPELSRPHPDLPPRTFYDYVSQAKRDQRLRANGAPERRKSSESLLERLSRDAERDPTAFLEEIGREERDGDDA